MTSLDIGGNSAAQFRAALALLTSKVFRLRFVILACTSSLALTLFNKDIWEFLSATTNWQIFILFGALTSLLFAFVFVLADHGPREFWTGSRDYVSARLDKGKAASDLPFLPDWNSLAERLRVSREILSEAFSHLADTLDSQLFEAFRRQFITRSMLVLTVILGTVFLASFALSLL